MVAGTKLTNTEYMNTAETIGAQQIKARFTLRQCVDLLSAVYNYTLSFVIEEQSVFPHPGERSEQYNLQMRSEALTTEALPLVCEAGPILSTGSNTDMKRRCPYSARRRQST
jgi:TetR/AcrR family tetracycline transcriptional repressor